MGKESVESCCRCMGEFVLVVASMTGLLLCAMYKFYEASQWSFTGVLGVNIDLTLRYPDFDLSAKLNVFHVLTFVLFALDLMDLVRKSMKHISKKNPDPNTEEEPESPIDQPRA